MTRLSLTIQTSTLSAWAVMAAECIESRVVDVIAEHSICSLMLTGGETAKKLYQTLRLRNALADCRINYYLGDERCVEINSPESNYGIIKQTLFSSSIPSTWSIHRITAEEPDPTVAASRYGMVLPRPVDVLLLGMGVDGHVASLFPNNFVLSDNRYGVIAVNNCPGIGKRITITPQVIREARSVFLLATGKAKGVILRKVLEKPKPCAELPVSLVTNATWLLDTDASNELLNYKNLFTTCNNTKRA